MTGLGARIHDTIRRRGRRRHTEELETNATFDILGRESHEVGAGENTDRSRQPELAIAATRLMECVRIATAAILLLPCPCLK